MTRIEAIIEDVKRRQKTIGCLSKTGLLYYLNELGFTVRAGKTDNHKVVTHPDLSKAGTGFTTFGIDCGHGHTKTVKPCYAKTVLNSLIKYQEELNTIYKVNNGL
ncbi:MAG: hypothetical protein KIB04_09765 [Pantoea sp.]|nr:hypothetical protein [Pantoea sp.]